MKNTNKKQMMKNTSAKFISKNERRMAKRKSREHEHKVRSQLKCNKKNKHKEYFKGTLLEKEINNKNFKAGRYFIDVRGKKLDFIKKQIEVFLNRAEFSKVSELEIVHGFRGNMKLRNLIDCLGHSRILEKEREENNPGKTFFKLSPFEKAINETVSIDKQKQKQLEKTQAGQAKKRREKGNGWLLYQTEIKQRSFHAGTYFIDFHKKNLDFVIKQLEIFLNSPDFASVSKLDVVHGFNNGAVIRDLVDIIDHPRIEQKRRYDCNEGETFIYLKPFDETLIKPIVKTESPSTTFVVTGAQRAKTERVETKLNAQTAATINEVTPTTTTQTNNAKPKIEVKKLRLIYSFESKIFKLIAQTSNAKNEIGNYQLELKINNGLNYNQGELNFNQAETGNFAPERPSGLILQNALQN